MNSFLINVSVDGVQIASGLSFTDDYLLARKLKTNGKYAESKLQIVWTLHELCRGFGGKDFAPLTDDRQKAARASNWIELGQMLDAIQARKADLWMMTFSEMPKQ